MFKSVHDKICCWCNPCCDSITCTITKHSHCNVCSMTAIAVNRRTIQAKLSVNCSNSANEIRMVIIDTCIHNCDCLTRTIEIQGRGCTYCDCAYFSGCEIVVKRECETPIDEENMLMECYRFNLLICDSSLIVCLAHIL